MNKLNKILYTALLSTLTCMPTKSFAMDGGFSIPGFSGEEVETDYGTRKIWVDLYICETPSPDSAVDFSNNNDLNILHEGDRYTVDGIISQQDLLSTEIDGREHVRFSHISYGENITQEVSIIRHNLLVHHRPLFDDELSPDLLPYKDVINQFMKRRTFQYTPND